MKISEKEKRNLEDLADVLKTEQGRNVIWNIMDLAGLMSRVSELDYGQSQRALGRREIALELHDMVMLASPRAFLKMLEQRAEEIEKGKNND